MLEQIFEDLPEEPELAFLALETSFRDQCDRALSNFDLNQEFPREVYLSYMTRTMAAAKALELEYFHGWTEPNSTNFSTNDYSDFRSAVDGLRTSLSIVLSRRAKAYSVAFDVMTKRKIAHFIEQIREIVGKLEIDEWKRDALLNRLNAFQAEVDRNRSGYAVFGALIIEMSGVLGTAAERMEPVRKFIDSIAGLIWGTKHNEQSKLPPPTVPKRIPPPKSSGEKPAGGKRNDLDDDIPF